MTKKCRTEEFGEFSFYVCSAVCDLWLHAKTYWSIQNVAHDFILNLPRLIIIIIVCINTSVWQSHAKHF